MRVKPAKCGSLGRSGSVLLIAFYKRVLAGSSRLRPRLELALFFSPFASPAIIMPLKPTLNTTREQNILSSPIISLMEASRIRLQFLILCTLYNNPSWKTLRRKFQQKLNDYERRIIGLTDRKWRAMLLFTCTDC